MKVRVTVAVIVLMAVAGGGLGADWPQWQGPERNAISKERGLPTWNKPSAACLATRIPYNEPVTKEKCDQVRLAEEYVCSIGFTSCRLRHHGSVARIEVPPSEIERLFDEATRRGIVEHLKGFGFTYIVVDLEGYRSGSMNETLDR